MANTNLKYGGVQPLYMEEARKNSYAVSAYQ